MTKSKAEVGLRGGVVRNPAKREQQRRDIIAAAARVFARTGYENATMTDVAREMGVSKGVLYYQFQSKAELIVATRIQSVGQATATLAEIIARPVPVAERMREALRAHVQTNFEELSRHVILLPRIVGLDDSSAREVRELERRYEELLSELVQEGITSGAFVEAPVRLTVFTLIKACASPAFWFREGGSLSQQDVVEGLTEQLMRSLIGSSSTISDTRTKKRPKRS
ncbi:TetR/AcrR family transcriptional regulator [Cumulibacter soli]|uniref:TetR/AcrR family transcriptional regulator n=1 Tax=Cumulibacter soli TaxID=2546344 RepID=UPI0014197411|nr:TetR/AcrR family transcriptional regulator [Cumulibacter soli]